MKKLTIVALIMIALIAITGTSSADIPTNLKVFDETTVGAKVDLPDLIKFTKNSSVGIEAGVGDIAQDWKDTGYIFFKYSWTGSLLDFSKK